MMHLVTGGSGSGKSEYAEGLALEKHRTQQGLYYIATMKPYGEEGKKRILRHRNLPNRRKFTTIECYENPDSVLEHIPKNAVVLLECMSNLLANAMFSEDLQEEVPFDLQVNLIERKCSQLKEQLLRLQLHCKTLIIVTNEIFSDGTEYDILTKEYQRQLGRMNALLAFRSDTVTEVVCGIPIRIK